MQFGYDSHRDIKRWYIRREDRLLFLRPSKQLQEKIDQCVSDKNVSIGHQCLRTLQNITESLQKDHVLITDGICFCKEIWELQVYKDDPSAFPIANVPIKCNVMSTMVNLLRDYPAGDMSDEFMARMVTAFEYLRKLLGAAASKTDMLETAKQAGLKSSNSSSPSPSPSVSPESPRIKRWSSGTLSSRDSVRRKSFFDDDKGVTVRASFQVKEKNLRKDNVCKFHEYKPLIVSLHHRLTFLDQSNRKNDIIFDFVLQNICKFIIEDCKLLLVDYIDRRILQL